MAPPAPVPAPLAGFKRLNSSTYLYESPASSSLAKTTSTTPPPDLILIPAWLDAAPRHIAKYTRGYQALYPTARILLLTSTLTDFTVLGTRRAVTARLAPALAVLKGVTASDGKILLHSFSNGGAYTAYLLGQQYYSQDPHHQRLPLQAQILDSAPSSAQYSLAITALSLSLPQKPWVLYFVCLCLLHVFLTTYSFLTRLTGTGNAIEKMREGLLDRRFWDPRVPRVYVYSKEDKMVGWEDVVGHAGQAWGDKVSLEEFKGSPHCGHLLVDEERYWGLVIRAWSEGRGVGGGNERLSNAASEN